MKKLIKLIAFSLFGIFSLTQMNAQVQNTWVGGTPGRPIDWNIATNWSLHRIPDFFHDVVIPNTSTTTFSYPVIDEEVEINSLTIESGAKLVILETGNLKLLRPGTLDEALANRGELENRSRHFVEFNLSVNENHREALAAEKQ